MDVQKTKQRSYRGLIIGVIVTVLSVCTGFWLRSRGTDQIQPFDAKGTPEEALSIVARVLEEEKRLGVENRDRFLVRVTELHDQTWFASKQQAVSEKQEILRQMRSDLQVWEDATSSLPDRIFARLTSLRLPQEVVDGVVAGGRRGVEGAKPMFLLRRSQLDALDQMLKIMTSSPWTSAGHGVQFTSPTAQLEFDSQAAIADKAEAEIAGIEAELKAKR